MSITLGPLFSKPLHPREWARPPRPLPGWDHNRITWQFDDPDALPGNTGGHRATDTGDGQQRASPILAAAAGRWRGLAHWDGALGAEGEMGPGIVLRHWHLSETLPVTPLPATVAKGPWQTLPAGAKLGMTGNTGRQPMAWHTHTELWIDDVRVDPEPHLVVVGRTPEPIVSRVRPTGLQALITAQVGPGNRIRVDPATTEGSAVTSQTETVQVLGWVNRPDAPWRLPGGQTGTGWLWLGIPDRVQERIPLDVGFIADALAPCSVTQLGQGFLPPADCSAQDNQIAAARTAVDGAAQAIAAAQAALR